MPFGGDAGGLVVVNVLREGGRDGGRDGDVRFLTLVLAAGTSSVM